MIQISKRGAVSRKRNIAIRLAAIVLAIIVCAIITMATTGTDPLAVFSAFINGSFGSERKLWIFLQEFQHQTDRSLDALSGRTGL